MQGSQLITKINIVRFSAQISSSSVHKYYVFTFYVMTDVFILTLFDFDFHEQCSRIYAQCSKV